jgi:hypothetical protein
MDLTSLNIFSREAITKFMAWFADQAPLTVNVLIT